MSARPPADPPADPPAGPPIEPPILLTISRDEDGERLDRALTSLLRGAGSFSRAALQRWIREGRVTLDERVCEEPKTPVRSGMRVTVRPAPPPPSAALPEALPLETLYVDDDVIVVNKAAGMVTHPAPGHEGGTLVNAVLHHHGVLARASGLRHDADEPEADGERDEASDGASDGASDEASEARAMLRPGIVHRLDRFTSGVMVIARSDRARESLMEQLASHSIDREYVAIAEGLVPRAATYDTLHGRHPTDRKRFSGRVSRGKRAVTHVERLEVLRGASLVRCHLETGRTHQIRVHLSEAGFPLLADAVYGHVPKDPLLREAAEAIGRQALHARLLGFEHPASGRRLRFEAEPPEDFRRALALLAEPPPAPLADR